jgi:lipopolysaccharide transport system ATP-binding protein
VGDAEFQKKAIGKMQDISHGDGRTVLFVSHNMGSMSKLCNKGVLLQNGYIGYRGGIDETIDYYLQDADNNGSSIYLRERKAKDAPIWIKKAILTNSNGDLSANFGTKDSIILKIDLEIKENIPLTNLLVTIVDKNQTRIGSINTRVDDKCEFIVEIKPEFLTRGKYSFLIHVYQPGLSPYDVLENLCPFSVIDSGTSLSHLETFNYGMIFPNMNWL